MFNVVFQNIPDTLKRLHICSLWGSQQLKRRIKGFELKTYFLNINLLATESVLLKVSLIPAFEQYLHCTIFLLQFI